MSSFLSNIMLYNIKAVYLHCVFHGIRFKVNEDWVSVIDTLLFFVHISLLLHIITYKLYILSLFSLLL